MIAAHIIVSTMTTRAFAGWLICSFALLAHADQVIMQNGDRYHGKVVSVSTNALVLQSDVLGTVNLSRSKVSQIVIGNEVAATSASQPKPATLATPKTNADVTLAATVRQLKSQPQLIQQVQNQYLNDASPEAKAKFDQMLTDLSTGKMSVDGLRAEAKSTADQLRAMRKELGEDAGEGLDGYLAILDNFVQESAPTATATNAGTPLKPTLIKQK